VFSDKLDFNINSINFADIYEGIPRKYWHNAILSVNDGIFTYILNTEKIDETTKIMYKGKIDFSQRPIIQYPEFLFINSKIETDIHLKVGEKSANIAEFFVSIAQLINYVYNYDHDAITYLGIGNKSLFWEGQK